MSDTSESLGASKDIPVSDPGTIVHNGFGDKDDETKNEEMDVTVKKNKSSSSNNENKDKAEENVTTPKRKLSIGRMRSRSKSKSSTDEEPVKNEEKVEINLTKEKKNEENEEDLKMDVDSPSTSSTAVKEEESKPDDTSSEDKDDEEDFLGFESFENKYAVFSAILSQYNCPNENELLSKQEDESGSMENGPLSLLLNPVVQLKSLTSRSSKKSSLKSIDICNNPEFRKPFEYGWVRELVYRNSNDGNMKRNADVYYYTPSNKKVRSTREVSEHLFGDVPLTVENFTFWKEPIGIDDPCKEIIREAKEKFAPNRFSEDGSTPANSKAKAMPKAKGTKANSNSIPDGILPGSSPITPKIVFKSNANVRKNTKKLSTKGEKKRKSAGPDDSEMDKDDLPEWSPDSKPQAREVCSIECPLAMGIIPTLKCITCLCLYHPECVSLPQAKHRQIHSYICKNCQSAKAATSKLNLPPPPPLTPIQPNSPPKRDRDSKSPGATGQGVPLQRGQSIVDAMTTWLPPTSSIQLGSSKNTLTSSSSAPRPTAALDSNPQSLIAVHGKKFILIPKHNVVKLDNLPPTDGGGDATTITSQSQSAVNPPGVLLVPCTTGTSTGTFVVQSGKSTSSTYIVTSPHSAPQISSLQLSNGLKRGSSEASDSSPPEKLSKVVNATGKTTPTSAKVVANATGKTTPTSTKVANATGKTTPVPAKGSPKNHSSPPSVPMSVNFMMNINAGFIALLHSFQYLKVHELLRASCVSRMWRHIATHPSLWETVKMKNSRVGNWDGFGTALRNNGTKCLDLKKMLLPESADATLEMWNGLAKAIATVPTLKKIDLGRCIPEALQLVTSACPQLESIVSLTIRGQSLDASYFMTLQNLQELRIKSVGGFDVTNLGELKSLTRLKHLAITTAKNLKGIEDALSESLETLELGECGTLSEELATVALPKLTNLKRLRLEKGQGSLCPTTQIIAAVANLENLKQLELINFDIKPGFDKVLAKCVHLRTLLIIPTYVTQSATTNHVVMGGVSKLSGTLTYFIWGLTLELLRVTDLFIDQVEAHKPKSMAAKKGSGDSIPILKPLSDETIESNKDGQTTSQVDILALPKLQKVLSTLLPTTKIKILKVPFSATWRQTVDI